MMSRAITLICLFISTLLVVFVFAIKYSVQDLETEYESLNSQIEQEQRAIHILRAEWSYLNEPLRLKALAELYLDGSRLTYKQMESLEVIPLKVSVGSLEPAISGTAMPIKDRKSAMASIEAVLQELRDKEVVP